MATHTAPQTFSPPVPERDEMPLSGIDHVEMYGAEMLEADPHCADPHGAHYRA